MQIAQLEVTSDDATFKYEDTANGAHRYRVELINDANQRIVVTSHLRDGGSRRHGLRRLRRRDAGAAQG
ncbi:MAG: hypothetical protein IPQ07_37470 [Myxococcales bacterium]|nr:hypothetical protein [Myxococcales bacterium]